eukprot:scaffold5671_cov105-Isochrysis_galbana.AAC.5
MPTCSSTAPIAKRYLWCALTRPEPLTSNDSTSGDATDDNPATPALSEAAELIRRPATTLRSLVHRAASADAGKPISTACCITPAARSRPASESLHISCMHSQTSRAPSEKPTSTTGRAPCSRANSTRASSLPARTARVYATPHGLSSTSHALMM